MLTDLILGERFSFNYLFLRRLRIRVLTFFAKLPIYGLHHWLPKAHVECVAWGSAVLARIVLKFGSFSILRHKVFFLVGCLLCLKCLYDMWFTGDFKVWVAYSSISHITLVFSRFVNYYEMCFIYYFVPHTLLSGLMFFYYSKDYYKLRSWNLYFFSSSSYLILAMAWCGIPVFLNFIPELMVLLRFFKFNMFMGTIYFINFVVFFFVLCKFGWRSFLNSQFRPSFLSGQYLFYAFCILQFWLFL